MPLSFMPLLRLKRCHACDQCHSSRVATFLPVRTVNCVQTLKVWVDGAPVYFRGHSIFHAVLADLRTRYTICVCMQLSCRLWLHLCISSGMFSVYCMRWLHLIRHVLSVLHAMVAFHPACSQCIACDGCISSGMFSVYCMRWLHLIRHVLSVLHVVVASHPACSQCIACDGCISSGMFLVPIPTTPTMDSAMLKARAWTSHCCHPWGVLCWRHGRVLTLRCICCCHGGGGADLVHCRRWLLP
jgi:hypothetical protein